MYSTCGQVGGEDSLRMSQIPKAKSSLPKPSLAQVATATGSQLDLLAGKNDQTSSK